MVNLAYKRCNRQHLDLGEYAIWRNTTHLYAGCGNKWDVSPQVQGNPLAELSCHLRADGLWVHKVTVHRA